MKMSTFTRKCPFIFESCVLYCRRGIIQARRRFFFRRWRFLFSTKKRKGVGSIRKNKIGTTANITGVALGAALLAASFFVLRGYRKYFNALAERVEELEYGCLCEAYKQQGYEVG